MRPGSSDMRYQVCIFTLPAQSTIA